MLKFSLALGGGAARGLAHIGIIKYLEKNNLTLEEISGTSMGAIIASLYAFGKNPNEMIAICKEINYFKLMDFDLKKGIIKGDKIKKFLKDIFGNTKIEELKIPLKIIATSIKTGEKIVFDKGSIVDAIRSSISIPGLIMPNICDGDELIDGGIVNNLPIDVLEGRNIIAVSVLRDITRKIETKMKILGIEFNQNIFGLSYQILQKTIDIMMKQNESKSLSLEKKIIYIHPKFVGVDYYEFNKYEEIINIGYEEAKKIKLTEQIDKKFKKHLFGF